MILEISPQLRKLLLERQEIDVIDSHTYGQPTRVIPNATVSLTGWVFPSLPSQVVGWLQWYTVQ